MWLSGQALRAAGRRWWGGELAPLVGLAGLAVLVVLLVDPRGDFPLNDDWCFALAVRHLLREGEVRLTDWGSMTLVTQILWGAVFSLPRGFSFEALRVSSLVLGLVALVASYVTLRELEVARGLAVLAALTLLANPLFVVLAHTFMTDVPFLGFSTAAVYLLVRAFTRDSRPALAGGLSLALAATFVRQLGLVLFIGFALASLWRRWRTGRDWMVAWAPLLGAFGLLRWYEAWLARRGSLPENYYLQWRLIRADLSAGVGEMIGRSFGTALEMAIYLGLFVLPIAAMWIVQRGGRRRTRLSVVAVATLVTLTLASRQWLVPYFSNILLDIQCATDRIVVGPLTLRDGCTADRPGLGELPYAGRWLLTWFGLVGAGSLVAAVFESEWKWRHREYRAEGAVILLVVVSGSYLALMTLIHVFDRYLLFVAPLVLALFARTIRTVRYTAQSLALGGAVIVSALLFGVGATQEYLDWNRARWRAIDYLTETVGAKREEIDGGFEFGGWVNFDARLRDDRVDTGWWVVDDRFVVSFRKVRGYRVLARFPYRGWFGLTEGKVLALSRRAPQRGSRG